MSDHGAALRKPEVGEIGMSDEITSVKDSEKSERQGLNELQAFNAVVAALQLLSEDAVRERVLHAATVFLHIPFGGERSTLGSGRRQGTPGSDTAAEGSFSEDRTISPKDFLLQKQPSTEVERVACLAYYLTHYRDVPHFKTIDVSKLNTEAAQPKFGNAAQAVDNAAKTHYLVPASKGNKQLSAQGEMFVQALPDRDAARGAMNSARPRRRKRGVRSVAGLEDASGDE